MINFWNTFEANRTNANDENEVHSYAYFQKMTFHIHIPLTNARYKKRKIHPSKRLRKFFTPLMRIRRRGKDAIQILISSREYLLPQFRSADSRSGMSGWISQGVERRGAILFSGTSFDGVYWGCNRSG